MFYVMKHYTIDIFHMSIAGGSVYIIGIGNSIN